MNGHLPGYEPILDEGENRMNIIEKNEAFCQPNPW